MVNIFPSPLLHGASHGSSGAQARAGALAALRAHLRAAEPGARHGAMAFGDASVDGLLPGGGLPLGQLHEVMADGIEAETGASAAGFLACLLAGMARGEGGGREEKVGKTIFWVSRLADLHAPGLLAYGLDPAHVIFARTGSDAETLAAMETALRGGAAAAVVGEAGKLGRTPSRRLQMACLGRGATGFVLRRWPWGQGFAGKCAPPAREATASATRWLIAPAPTAGPHRELGPTRWKVALTYARGGAEGKWIMEAADDGRAAHPLRVVAELADATAAPQSARRRAG